MAAPTVICSQHLGGCTPTDSMGVLVINGTLMLGPAWTCIDLRSLWLSPTRGKNKRIPHLEGERPYPRRIDAAYVSLDMWISGAVDQVDTPYASYMDGLFQNLADLRAAVIDPPLTGATVPASLWAPDLVTELVADVQIWDFEFGQAAGELHAATLDLVIPSGGFELPFGS